MTMIFTIGYEGTDIERFVATLETAGIRQLADVRAVAVSRKKGFSKTKLSARLAVAGIRYAHFRALGDPKPGREAARAGRHAEFLKIYTNHLRLYESQDALENLADYVADEPTCLLCYERDPATCHRLIVAERIGERLSAEVFHLFADKLEKYGQHASAIPRPDPRKGLAAAE
ncbi:MAG: Protein of unknown function, DUF488 [Saliniramus fredricksonii]|uniref:DUF488 domain-containing protein n=1 Tax=Saliniramus fredricksonii TaxID=1653334 RepID=A0A0P7ZVE6_9HYPH|nr:DUF488 domain-containing protein [Saliniramus fredricksonii]KPQ08680.1 MAG: Protein of unknown function, DUF488 [Saliniramus fredricksonii]SCC81190.1 Protein of unknown function, DUF488 [Saliniramus fredricksonii]